MRITEKMVHRRLVASLQASKNRLTRSQERIGSSRNIRRPSDDPIGFMKIMNYRSELSKVEQTETNIRHASIVLSQIDNELEAAGDLVLDMKNKASIMATDTNSAEDRLAILAEVTLMFDDILQKANTEFGGQYLFAGHKTTRPPYARQAIIKDSRVTLSGGGPVGLPYSLPADGDVTVTVYDSAGTLVRTDSIGAQVGGDYTYSWDGADGAGAAVSDGEYDYEVSVDFGNRVEYVGDQGLISQKIELNSSMVVNMPGSDVFGVEGDGVFSTIDDFMTALANNDQVGIQSAIAAFDADMNRIVEARGLLGMRIRRVDSSKAAMDMIKPMIADNLAQIENVDVVLESAEYLATQEAYQAILKTAGSMLQLPSLLDYLR